MRKCSSPRGQNLARADLQRQLPGWLIFDCASVSEGFASAGMSSRPVYGGDVDRDPRKKRSCPCNRDHEGTHSAQAPPPSLRYSALDTRV